MVSRLTSLLCALASGVDGAPTWRRHVCHHHLRAVLTCLPGKVQQGVLQRGSYATHSSIQGRLWISRRPEGSCRFIDQGEPEAAASIGERRGQDRRSSRYGSCKGHRRHRPQGPARPWFNRHRDSAHEAISEHLLWWGSGDKVINRKASLGPKAGEPRDTGQAASGACKGSRGEGGKEGTGLLGAVETAYRSDPWRPLSNGFEIRQTPA